MQAPVPTDQYALNLNDKRLLVDPHFSVKLKDFEHCKKQAWGESDSQDTRYKVVEVKDFERIFQHSNNDKDHNPRLILIQGDPGVGKTTLSRLYTLKWALAAKNNLKTITIIDSPIAYYKLVVYLPLASLAKHAKMSDMLLDAQLQYFQPFDRIHVESFLEDPTNLDQTLFILDGLDDVTLSEDSDVAQLMAGNLYPEAKVAVCSRPYRASIAQLNADPDVIVTVHGLTKLNATRLLHLLLDGEMSMDMSEFIDNKCLMLNTDLQLNPLCLNLICFNFQYHLRLGKLAEDFELPQTRTALFNAYFKMLLRLHLKSVERGSEECTFIKNPLSQDAQIPSDLKHIIYVVSRLSFLALANEKYDFSEDDLQVNLLSSKTLKDIGIVTDIASSANNKRYFFRHKMLAEHLAGIYLSMEGFRVPEYTQRLESGENMLLSDRLGSFHNMVAFAAGVSSVFFRELCKSATEHCVLKGLPDKDTFLHPQDAVLFLETQDPNAADTFARYLLDAPIVKTSDDIDLEPSVYEWSAALYFVDNINFQTVCDLFERFYHLKMYQREQRDDDETDSHFDDGAINIETVQKRLRGKYRNYDTLDFQQCGLLFSAAASLMVFHNIRSVVIDDGVDGRNSVFLQLKDVVKAFPSVSEMEMRRVTLYSTEHRIGFMKDLLGDLDFSDSEDEEEAEGDERQHPLKSLTFDQIHPNESVVRDMKALQNVENFQVNSSQILENGFESLAAAIQAAPRMRVFSINNNHLGWSAMVLLQALFNQTRAGRAAAVPTAHCATLQSHCA